jgi:hypothetical protein
MAVVNIMNFPLAGNVPLSSADRHRPRSIGSERLAPKVISTLSESMLVTARGVINVLTL